MKIDIMNNSSMEKVITGYWDNEPIWRYKTKQEELLEAVQKVEEKRLSEKSKN